MAWTFKVLIQFLFLFCCALPPLELRAQAYSWTDSQGRVHYSNKALNPGAEAKELPQISRENINAKIKSIKQSIPANCNDHGGVDCGLREDADGSVICIDGYKDAILAYRKACGEVRVEVSPVELSSRTGEIIGISVKNEVRDQDVEALHLTLRNTAAIEAQGMVVEFLVPFTRKWIEALGPTTIEALSIGEYKLPRGLFPYRGDLAKTPLKARVSCRNCSTVQARVD
ncbi:DUF4124 domain-containing protein [bacterium]|nr:DUF4124 domain-containing protein [bacterium]